MPVTSPSEFPPHRSPDQVVGLAAGKNYTGQRAFLSNVNAGANSNVDDIYIIGDSAFSAGVTDANAQYSVVIGSGNLAAATSFTGVLTDFTASGPAIVIGGNNFPKAVNVAGTLAIGTNIAPGLGSTPIAGNAGANTIIGINACSKINSVQDDFNSNVIIGFQAYQGASASEPQDAEKNVLIGTGVCVAGGPSGFGEMAGNVVLGYRAAKQLAGASGNNVIIGQTAGGSLTTSSASNTVVGNNSDCTGSGQTFNVVLGAASQCFGEGNTLLGSQIVSTGTTGNGSILIGNGCGNGLTGSLADVFLIETQLLLGATKKTILFGSLAQGCLIVGDSTSGTNRDIGNNGADLSLNLLKLLEGHSGGANPAGGGFLYVSDGTAGAGTAGSLVYISPGGTQTQIAPD